MPKKFQLDTVLTDLTTIRMRFCTVVLIWHNTGLNLLSDTILYMAGLSKMNDWTLKFWLDALQGWSSKSLDRVILSLNWRNECAMKIKYAGNSIGMSEQHPMQQCVVIASCCVCVFASYSDDVGGQRGATHRRLFTTHMYMKCCSVWPHTTLQA